MENQVKQAWVDRLALADTAFERNRATMTERENIYKGTNLMRPLTQRGEDSKKGCKTSEQRTCHVYNTAFEQIETQIDSNIPAIKVTAMHQQDDDKAKTIERMIANQLDLEPSEELNDQAERTVPIQGGLEWLIDWDNNKPAGRELLRSMVHPLQMRPQPMVFTDLEEMDWNIVNIPSTRGAVRRRYGVELPENEPESNPESRSTSGEEENEDAVTVHIGYERNDNGSINRYAWCNETELEDLENYQARRRQVCKTCGRTRPTRGQLLGYEEPEREELDREIQDSLAGQAMAGQMADELMGVVAEAAAPAEKGEAQEIRYDGEACPFCGGTEFTDEAMEYEEIWMPVMRDGVELIPGQQIQVGDDGVVRMEPTRVPFYRPDIYPLVLQRNVSMFGQLLGGSDIDVIRDQQNSINQLEQKILNRLMKAGTRVSLPKNRTDLRLDGDDGKPWYVDQKERNCIGTYQFNGDLQYELLMLDHYYEEERRLLGITDSFQGRHDPTATSGKAKEFAAARAAGRMESKRIMKNAAYAHIGEAYFKFKLAYSDAPEDIHYRDEHGVTRYETFDRYAFLRQNDETGEWEYNTDFLFSCDNTAALAANREAMWQESRMNFQTGAFGDSSSLTALIIFWTVMAELHYPMAESVKATLEEQQQSMQAMQAAMPPQVAAPQQPMAPAPGAMI